MPSSTDLQSKGLKASKCFGRGIFTERIVAAPQRPFDFLRKDGLTEAAEAGSFADNGSVETLLSAKSFIPRVPAPNAAKV
jgi:hypothetical protein